MDIPAFCSNHKWLCVGTFGLAIPVYAMGCGIVWILEKAGCIAKTDATARQVLNRRRPPAGARASAQGAHPRGLKSRVTPPMSKVAKRRTPPSTGPGTAARPAKISGAPKKPKKKAGPGSSGVPRSSAEPRRAPLSRDPWPLKPATRSPITRTVGQTSQGRATKPADLQSRTSSSSSRVLQPPKRVPLAPAPTPPRLPPRAEPRSRVERSPPPKPATPPQTPALKPAATTLRVSTKPATPAPRAELPKSPLKPPVVRVPQKPAPAGLVVVPKPAQTKIQLENGRLDLIDAKFPEGVTQYTYPKTENLKRSQRDQACPFHSASFVLYMRENFGRVVESFSKEDTDSLIEMRKKILDQGLQIRDGALKNGLQRHIFEKNEVILRQEGLSKKQGMERALSIAAHLQEIDQFTDAFSVLKFPDRPNDLMFGIQDDPFDQEALAAELDIVFSRGPRGLPYCLIQAEGQTFALCHINQDQAFLFDPHKSWFAVVSKEEAAQYLTEEILHLDQNPVQGAEFFHGSC